MATQAAIRAFRREVDAMLGRADGLSDSAVQRVLDQLDATEREIVNQLSHLAPTDFTAVHLRQTRAIVDREISQLVATYQRDIPGYLSQASDMGTAMVEEPLAAAGAGIGTLGLAISPVQVIVSLAQFSADLIDALGAEARKRISTVLTQAALGVITPYDAIQQVAGNLPGASTFGTVRKRAEAIVRTEVGRATSIAGDIRMGQMADRLPGLQKRWLAVDDSRTRSEHFTVGDFFADSSLPTVVDAKGLFVVGGEDAKYPRDPLLSPGNSINCRCHSVPEINSKVLAHLGVAA